MKIFACSHCSNVVYFNNTVCESCGFRLGYHPARNMVHALTPNGADWVAGKAPRTRFRFCANAEYGACNWLIRASNDGPFCVACRHNRTIPDLSIEQNLILWRKIEAARHHLFYSLTRFGLPLETRAENPAAGLAFDVLADNATNNVLTGHAEGVITLNLAEADDPIREQRRAELHEPYRTLLGHFRHEIGHYYWDRLVRDGGRVDAFRAVFGDETRNYDAALKAHYADGPPANWRDSFITAYASAHPWEDFAEIWAHYFHIVDTTEMARSYGIQVNRGVARKTQSPVAIDFDPYFAGDTEQLIDRWHSISVAVNDINRCMGQPDLYPFVLTPTVIAKMGFVHELVHAAGDAAPAVIPKARIRRPTAERAAA